MNDDVCSNLSTITVKILRDGCSGFLPSLKKLAYVLVLPCIFYTQLKPEPANMLDDLISICSTHLSNYNAF